MSSRFVHSCSIEVTPEISEILNKAQEDNENGIKIRLDKTGMVVSVELILGKPGVYEIQYELGYDL